MNRFSQYTQSELASLSHAFKSDVDGLRNKHPMLDTEAWTEAVLTWWFNARSSADQEVCARRDRRRTATFSGQFQGPRDTAGEFLVDLCHTTYPNEPLTWHASQDYWSRAVTGSRCMTLALESEWGDSRSRDASRNLILDDAAKLAFLRAKTKILLFSTNDKTGREFCDIEGHVSLLRASTGDTAPWLLADVPWDTHAKCKCKLLL